ncbi:hypothetical protein QBC44DRAFT_303561 [Cladorrhinum sp. PSN332]|nr:hypothetical protein QBC44DRAFT_303561 [Cladorrhinum sp. PSN332]
MERDSRRDRGQWRGCYTFKDIILDGDARSVQKRDGGLKMGNTYYYYYELDGSQEAHDPAAPSTNTCPYLPGQTVNRIEVPVEKSLRSRSASTSSLRQEDFKTMDPAAKFNTPKPAVAPTAADRRAGTAPHHQHKRSARSISPASGWRKLFSRKASSSSLRTMASTHQSAVEDDERGHSSSSRSEGSRSRDISPESLRRFLIDDAPLSEEPAVAIPEDIVEENEEDDDNDNFATSAVSETMQFTGLSPPPARAMSPSPPPTSYQQPQQPQQKLPMSKFNVVVPSVTAAVEAPLESPPAFYFSEAEEEEEEEAPLTVRNLKGTLSTYSLPQSAGASPASKDQDVPAVPSLLSAHQIPDSGLVDDLVSELGWMASFIGTKYA